MNPASLRAKFDAALNKVGPPLRTAYMRTITVTGGDALIGRQTSTTTDVLLNPQPLYTEQKVAGVLSNGMQVEAGDYHFLISGNSMTLPQLMNKSTRLVLKDPTNTQADQAFVITMYKVPSFGGQALGFSVIARSVAQ
jgi:hypothetical protein